MYRGARPLAFVMLSAACGAHAAGEGAAGPATLTGAFEPDAVLPPTCAAPFVLAPDKPDRWLGEAGKRPPIDSGAWWTRPMQGPFGSREDAAPGCRDVDVLPAAPPFATIVHCSTRLAKQPPGPGNEARHLLLLRTARGWWSQEVARDRWPRGGPAEELRVGAVRDLAALDRLGDGKVEITAIAEEGPPGGAPTRRLLVCGVGGSATPACADIRVAAGGPFRGPGTLQYRLELGCDGVLDVVGWEGGMQARLVHQRGRIAFP